MNTETTPAPKEVPADDRESLLRDLAHEVGPRQTGANTIRCRSCGFAWDVGAPAHHNTDCLHLRAKRILAASGAPQEAPGDAPSDSQMLDWLDENIFHREMDSWDRQRYPGKRMWVLFSPEDASGKARTIISAAMKGPQ